jgi:RHS repeat-associated protein
MSGLPERWQRVDTNSPFSQMTVHDGNQLTLIPIVNWPCRGGVLSVDLTLYHNAANTTDPPPDAPPLGPGWMHSLRTSLVEDPMLGTVTITEGDGRQHAFTRNEDYSYTHPPGVFETLVKNGDGTFRLTRHDQVQWNFSASGKLTSIVDLNNNSISLSYDSAGKLTSLADPSGRVLSFGYDGDGFLTSVTDPFNRVFTFSFTGTPKSLWKVTEPSPSTLFLEFGYDSVKRVTSVKDKRGNSWSMAYDGTGRVSSVTNPASGSRSYNYTDGTKVTDENGNYVTYQYGTSGQVTSFSEFPVLGGETTTLFVYDAQLNVTSNTRPSGAVWEYTWDSNGNLLTVEDPITRPDPNITRMTYTYNAANRRTSAKDAAGHEYTYGYSAQQNLTQVTDPASNITTYGYNSTGNRTSQTVNGKTTNLGYDANGNLTSITDPLSNQTRFTYNALGWKTSRIDALNRTTDYGYDGMGRLTTETYPDSSTVTFAYDVNGNRTSLIDGTGTTTWVYDSLNRTTSETKGTDTISYVYDAGSRRTSLTDQAGVTVTFEYDGANRLTKTSRGPTWNATYGYDANNNLISQTNPNGTTVTLGHNDADWLTSVVNKNSSATVLSSFTYAYNVDGLRSSVTEADGSQVAYGYDALHRLTSEVRTGTNPYTISYGYDPAGNRLNKVLNGSGTSYTYDDANRLLTAGSTSYTWNANGNLVSKTISGVTTNFAYDYDDQLTSITGPTNLTFGYDGLGRRASRIAGGVTTTTFYDGIHPTTEKQGATIVGHYTFGTKELVSWDNGTAYEYNLPDTFGSTRQVTDASQAVQAAFTFDAFGNAVSQSGSASNPYSFAGIWGYRTHGDAGLLLVGARYYDPEVGRFITADTWLGAKMDPQSLNRFVYAQNDPINHVDPTGHWLAAILSAILAFLEWAWPFIVIGVVVVIGFIYLKHVYDKTVVHTPP